VQEEIGAIGSGEAGEEFAEPSAQRRHGTLSSFAQQCFGLIERLLDGVEIRRVLGKVAECGTDGFDGFGDTVDLVSCGIVHDDDIAGPKGGRETLFDLGEEGISGHRPFDDEGSDHFVVAETCDEANGLPTFVRRVVARDIVLAWRRRDARAQQFRDLASSFGKSPRLGLSQCRCWARTLHRRSQKTPITSDKP
jgi:hypothetical protein